MTAPQDRHAYVIAGEIGAGKSTVSQILMRNHGFVHISYVDLIWKPILDERSLPYTRENLQKLGAELMRIHGPVNLARMILEYLPNDASFVIDDVRTEAVFCTLKKAIPSLKLVYIQVSDESRRKRAIDRDGVSMNEQLQAELFSTEREIKRLRRIADFHLQNDGRIVSLNLQVSNILNA